MRIQNLAKITLTGLIAIVMLAACEEKNPDEGYALIPDVHISREINIKQPEYDDLNHPGGYVYLDEGFRGVIVVQTYENRFKALERACPSAPKKTCARATVDSSRLFIGCGNYADSQWQECTQSKFNLDGSVMEGPADRPMKSYHLQKDGDFLLITNQGR